MRFPEYLKIPELLQTFIGASLKYSDPKFQYVIQNYLGKKERAV